MAVNAGNAKLISQFARKLLQQTFKMLHKITISFCFLTAVIAHKPSVYVVLIAGESNSIGFNTDGRTAEDVSYYNILQLSCCNNGREDWDSCKLLTGQDPLHHICDQKYLLSQNVGFGMSFARFFRTFMSIEDYLILVPSGIPDSGFSDDIWTPYTGFGFLKAVARVQVAMKLASKILPSHTAHFNSILWHQGETDADVNVSAREYLTKDLFPFISAWRNQSYLQETNENVTFVAGNLLPSWSENPKEIERLNVVVALQVLNQFVKGTMTVPSLGLVGNEGEKPELMHFNAKSQRLLGKRYFTAWAMSLLNNQVPS